MDAESDEGLKRRFSSAEVIGCDLTHFLPQRGAVSYNRLEEQVHVATHEIFGTARIPVQRRGLARDLEISTDAFMGLRKASDAHLGRALMVSKVWGLLHV